MSGITLLTDGTRYSSLLKRKLKNDGDRIVLLSDAASGDSAVAVSDKPVKQDSRDHSIVWNKRSPLSARNALLSTLNSYNKVDNAILIYQPGDYNKTFHETSSAVYDLQIDRWIKGYGYLLKEIIQLYIKQQNGNLSFILDSDGMTVLTPLESAVYSYLKNLVQSLSVLYQNEPLRINCFESDTSRPDDFIDFFIKNSSDSKYSPGRIHRFADKKSLFDFGKN
ncbi:MAG: hypothetical protein PQJ61_05585 [Spirochaetales bacterium]|uniref:Uncharacterized protein n=1 Tax=Candidatus Thalassospirochaeta sargassi TaxID=3119039 RepID=A0AAJ1MJX4_9SPIO|nr:hypothetical protein [Spirochaetales bacterium]